MLFRGTIGSLGYLAILLTTLSLPAAEFRIDGATLQNGQVEVRFPSHPEFYYILSHGNTVNEIRLVTDLVLGGNLPGVLVDPNPFTDSQFYRVERISILSPRDTDGDGINDVWELMNRHAGAALIGGDAEEDQNGNGVPDRIEFFRETLRQGAARNRPAVAAGRSHSLALKSDGTLFGWGDNYFGQLGNADYTETNAPAVVGTGSNWMALAAGESDSFAIQKDGTLWAWGENQSGELGLGSSGNVSSPTQIGADHDWISVSTGLQSTFAIKADGTLWGWKAGVTPGRIGTNTDWGAISAGLTDAAGLRIDGTLWAIGIGVPAVQIGNDTSWTTVSVGGFHALALKADGSLWAWAPSPTGNNAGQFGTSGEIPTMPTRIGFETNWIAVSAGLLHSTGIKSDGSLWAWGYNFDAELGIQGPLTTNAPIRVGTKANWLAVAAGSFHTVALDADGALSAWGQNSLGQLGTGAIGLVKQPAQVGSDSDWASISAGTVNAFAVKLDGTLWAWGGNGYGGLGSGTFNNSSVPAQVGIDADWARVSADRHTLAVKRDGSLWAWGDNRNGELGNGNQLGTAAPTRSGTGTNWIDVSAGTQHSMGLKSDGTLWAWGRNYAGDLGIGSFAETPFFTPTQVGSSTNWISVAAGYYNTVALIRNGSLWGWGQNQNGELDGIPRSATPEPFSFNNVNWTAAITGKASSPHSLGLKHGTLWAWGDNPFGQLGFSSPGNTSTPTQVGAKSNWLAIAVGDIHSVGLDTDGYLWAWGSSFNGQAGFGTRGQTNSPTLLGNDTNWSAISAGLLFTLALKSDHTLWAWGDNSYGQVGQPAVWTPAPVLGGIYGPPRW